jgi:N-acetyltransferase
LSPWVEGVSDAVGFVGGALAGFWIGRSLGWDLFAEGYGGASIGAILLVGLGGGLGLHGAGSMLPFAVLDAAGTPVGMTTYMNIDRVHRRVEIGSTWYAQRVQRTALNTECKRLLLGHAFETLDCIAVEFRTHRLNTQSRRAIERLGAQLDGILRAHQRTADGSLRDTAVYSITAAEWPTIRRHLDHQLSRPR